MRAYVWTIYGRTEYYYLTAMIKEEGILSDETNRELDREEFDYACMHFAGELTVEMVVSFRS